MRDRDEHVAGVGISSRTDSDRQGRNLDSVKSVAPECDKSPRGSAAPVALDQRDMAMLGAVQAISAASDLISVGDLAAQLGVSVRTIRRWQVLEDAPSRVKRSRRLMYRRNDVMAWLARLADRSRRPEALSVGLARDHQDGS